MGDLFQLVGKTVEGPVAIERVVGEGGFGVVYRGQHLSFGEPAAVKVLKLPGSLDDKQRATFLKKFQLEARILYKLSKQTLNVVRPMFFGSLDDTPVGFAPYCVMEWLEGRGLEDELAERQERIRAGEITAGRSIDELIGVIEPLVDALDRAHRLGVIHRDIKPANVFVLPEGQKPRIKLLDFGIAKLVDLGGDVAGTTTLSAGTLLALTPEYAAPEQWDHELGDVGPHTDVYALAMMLLELMLDRHPLAGLSNSQRMFTACNPQQRPGPRKYALEVNDEVEQLFAQALACKPDDRAGSVKAWWHALVQASRGASASANAPGASASAGGGANVAVAPTLLQTAATTTPPTDAAATTPPTEAAATAPTALPPTTTKPPPTVASASSLPATNVTPAATAHETQPLRRAPARGLWIGVAVLAIAGVAGAMWAAGRSDGTTASNTGASAGGSAVSDRAAKAGADGGAAAGAQDGAAAAAAGKVAVDATPVAATPDAKATASAKARASASAKANANNRNASAAKASTTKPRVSARPRVRGTLPTSVIRRVMRRHENEVRFCYLRGLGKNLRAGRVVIQFTIAATGQVVASRVQSSTLGSPKVETCIAKRVRRWLFPRPKGGGIVLVSYPFVLRALASAARYKANSGARTKSRNRPKTSPRSSARRAARLELLLREARRAYTTGQCGRATQAARSVLKARRNHQGALQILGACGCKLKRIAQARRAYRRLSASARNLLRSVCASRGLVIGRRRRTPRRRPRRRPSAPAPAPKPEPAPAPAAPAAEAPPG